MTRAATFTEAELARAIRAADKLIVTVVRRSRTAVAILDPEIVEAETGQRVSFPVAGHAKLIVDDGMDRNADWLMRRPIHA